ncbi:MAG: hypothetical protein HWD60_02290 [Defluviicoccus sp.]|nr:MAG: hypothetical protein HWD60_02290 [Defluviicoccus sp.]
MSDLDGLNPAQRTAVVFGITPERPARPAPPLLVIAGAGSLTRPISMRSNWSAACPSPGQAAKLPARRHPSALT